MKLIMLIFLGIYGFFNIIFFIIGVCYIQESEEIDLFPTIGCVIFPFSALVKMIVIILIKFSNFLATPLKKREKVLVYDYKNFGFIKERSNYFTGVEYLQMLVSHNCKKGDLWR